MIDTTTSPWWETIAFDYEAAVRAWEIETARLLTTYEIPWSGVNFAGVEGGRNIEVS